MIRVIIVFFLFYFWLSALVYADSHQDQRCENEMGMIMDSLERNKGCDKLDEMIPHLDRDYFNNKEETLQV
jgi:hypothetical protein|tara:strand:+ start:135 stop:347 length:213 start_codon:yes stop_codon:yes gene_type:complete